jgi:hypothetical protein
MSRRKARKSEYIPPSHEVVNRKERATGGPKAKGPRTSARAGREPEPPSLQKIIRRRLPVAAIAFFALQFLIISNSGPGKGDSLNERLLTAAAPALIMAALFVPMSYLMDRSMYRSWQRRNQKAK